MKAIQRVVKNGSSAQVTLIRAILFELDLRPGDFVEVVTPGDGTVTIRPWKNSEFAGRRSPGVVAESAPAVPR